MDDKIKELIAIGKVTAKSQLKPWRFSGVGPLIRAPREVSRERLPDAQTGVTRSLAIGNDIAKDSAGNYEQSIRATCSGCRCK